MIEFRFITSKAISVRLTATDDVTEDEFDVQFQSLFSDEIDNTKAIHDSSFSVIVGQIYLIPSLTSLPS
jgi:hypothetical protein